mmetsp:Transcript_28106/g.93399  ORF Transcript_28106/g.93399 Transcript_28106/m.93399 type:complete len:126 (+) Transcript_28106:119-496(+)
MLPSKAPPTFADGVLNEKPLATMPRLDATHCRRWEHPPTRIQMSEHTYHACDLEGILKGLMGGIPEHIPDPVPGGATRKPPPPDDAPPAFKNGMPNKTCNPMPSVVTNLRNMRNERPQCFARPVL